MALKALENGGFLTSPQSFFWDISRKCETPVELIFLSGRSAKDKENWHVWWDDDMTKRISRWVEHGDSQREYLALGRDRRHAHLLSSCRKCPSCLKARGYLWAKRAQYEVVHSSRTWFMSFTVAPEHRVRVKILSRRKYGDEEFDSCYKILSAWFTLYMKRVRKQSKCKLRFIMVCEAHKDGFPHLHALVHERGKPVTKRLLQAQWAYGFTSCKVADKDTSWYVTKYLTKSSLARVRASLRYGRALGHNEITEWAIECDKSSTPFLNTVIERSDQ